MAALQGIVDYFGSILLDEPILGLWRNEFVQGLLWKADIPLKRNRRRINSVPSWSWISIDGQIKYDELCLTLGAKCRDHHVYPSAKVISASVEWTGTPMTTAISSTNLTIEERLLPFRTGSSHGLESHPSVLFMLSSATEIGSCDFNIEMDPFPDKVWGFELGIINLFARKAMILKMETM